MKILNYLFLALIFTGAACNDDNDIPNNNGDKADTNWSAAADSSSKALVENFWNAQHKYFNYSNSGNTDFHYWPQAHALDVLVDAYERTGESLYLSTIKDWHDGVKARNGNSFYNVFYDDMEWNALAMLRAYNATEDERYKTAAEDVWEDIKTGWNQNGNGGIAWKKDQLHSKNACSNGPASILAARLYQKFGNEDDKEWAQRIYDWEKEYLFNPASGAVYDGLNANTGEVNTSWIFTYNQGTFLGAALELYDITGEKGYLNDAIKAADYTLNNLVNSNDQVLKSEGSGDGGLFKGIFIRYFIQLILHPDLSDGTRNRYRTFLKHNAETLWLKGTNKNLMLFGTYWADKPGTETDLTTQLSGAMLMEAAALLDSLTIVEP